MVQNCQKSHFSEGGFSILEIILVISILAILGWVAIPRFSEMNASFERANAVNQLEFDLRRARSEALSRGARCIFRLAQDGKSYSIGFDLLPFNQPSQIDETLLTRSLPNTVTAISANDIIFNSRGFVISDSGETRDSIITLLSKGNQFGTAEVTPMGGLSFTASNNGG